MAVPMLISILVRELGLAHSELELFNNEGKDPGMKNKWYADLQMDPNRISDKMLTYKQVGHKRCRISYKKIGSYR
jgi:hypothetical protein